MISETCPTAPALAVHMSSRDPHKPPDRDDLGPYPSLAAFARDVVAPLLRPEGQWLLDCLDVERVLRALAGDDLLRLEDGRVYLERRPRP